MDRSQLSRRQFLVAAAVVTTSLAGCAPNNPTTARPTEGRPPSPPPPTTPPSSATPPSPEPTQPQPTGSPNPTSTPSALTLRQRIASLLVVGFRGLELRPNDPIIRAIRNDYLGGVILFDRDQQTGQARNIASPDQLKALTTALRQAAGPRPFLIAVDQEGGRVARLGPQDGFPRTPSEAEIGRQASASAARTIGRTTATALASMGIDLNLAPVVDLNVNPTSPSIGGLDRSFSADPDVVVALAGAVIEGHHEKGVMTAIKHFPGLGSATGDTDRGVVDVSRTWMPRELDPFRRLVAAELPDAVMVANAVNRQLDARLPSSLSRTTVDLLRSALVWKGVVVTDDLQAAALRTLYSDAEVVRLAVQAGSDLLLLANQQVYVPDVVDRTIEAILLGVERGEITEAQIDAAAARVTTMAIRRTAPG